MLSVVIPFYDELQCIGTLVERTERTLLKHQIHSFEILIVENGSSDVQREGLVQQFANHPQVKILQLSRNFGYQGALWAGLDHASGDPVVFMDGDGEDPPEVIGEFIEKWNAGYHVVYGVRRSRKVGWILNLFYLTFYRLLARWAEVKLPLDAGEFSLVSGPALEAMRKFKDRIRMLRILRAWIGFRQIGVPYDREKRLSGKSKFSFLAAVRFAWDGFVAVTDIPVRMAVYSALLCVSLGVAGSLYYVFWYFFGKEKIPGFASLNITLLFLFSMLFLCISVLAKYVITLLNETRRRPPYLVQGVIKEHEKPQALKKVP